MKKPFLLRLCAFAFGLLVLLWLSGFALFVDTIGAFVEPPIDNDLTPTEAIVVLTGGSERLATGLDLLKAGKGQKLFISGVYPGLTLSQVLAKKDVSQDLRNCCIVLGHAADNTVGNAEETRSWMQTEGFHSLRIVTAYYHMPRSILVFSALLPDSAITPHPVVSEGAKFEKWWTRWGTTSLFATEYNKYLFARLRVFLETLS